jgi:hypothetical protein
VTGGEPVDAASGIPAPLDALGEVFVPIDPREKGTTRPRTPEHLHAPDDDVLEAHLEAGHNYGVACQNGLAVLDADEPDALQDAIDALPETAWQVSGSGSGEHYFLQVPGFDEDLKLYHPETDEHLGEVKGAAQSYVVGPGSIHPSGGRYGPLRGDTIATVAADELRELLEPFLRESTRSRTPELPHGVEQPGPSGVTEAADSDADLGVHDVVSRTRYPGGARREHPFHGSDTGANFMIDDGGDTFRCWRHDCTGNALHLVGIEQGIIDCGEWLPGGLDTDTWREIFAAAREAGYDLPEYESGEHRESVSALPLARLDALDPDDARRFARRRGVEWPTTREARERLRDELVQTLRAKQTKVVDAPTALGKSYTVATEPWLDRVDVTDGQPVVHLHKTREARDQAAEESDDANVAFTRLVGRDEACAVAAGRHDPPEDDEDAPDVVVTMDGKPASEWLRSVCDGRGVPFSVAHRYLDEHNDQDVDLPCCAEDGERCPTIAQWDDVPRADDTREAAFDVIHATHEFARVPSLRNGTNVVFDERPDFGTDLGHDRVREAVAAFLQAAGAPVHDFERFVARAHDPEARTPNEHAEHPYVPGALEYEPDREWYLEADGAHTLAPALAKAIWYALDDGADANGRFAATVPHDPPRLDAEAKDDTGWNREYVRVVLDADNTVRSVRSAPDFGSARAVVGLDAHPSMTLWQQNVHPDIRIEPVLGTVERQLWRRYERGLLVVQVGDATRPFASGEYFDPDGTEAFLRALRDQYGEDFRTGITASAVEHHHERILEDAGVPEPETMHFGEEKSRDDFGDENVGFVNGSIDPGDEYVLDLLAEASLDARPEMTTSDDGERRRAHGREFVGADADLAHELLASVREQHVARPLAVTHGTPTTPRTALPCTSGRTRFPPGSPTSTSRASSGSPPSGSATSSTPSASGRTRRRASSPTPSTSRKSTPARHFNGSVSEASSTAERAPASTAPTSTAHSTISTPARLSS